MKISVIDTNVLVRFLIGDGPSQFQLAKKWFTEAEYGQREIVIPAVVVAETVFVLQKFYKKPFGEIAEALKDLVIHNYLRVEQRSLLLAALKFYSEGKHFVDSYLLAICQQSGYELLTFDKQLKKQYASEL